MVFSVLSLAACGGGGSHTVLSSSEAGKAQITCADVSNNDPTCKPPTLQLISSAGAAMLVDGGSVSRSATMVASSTFTNDTASDFVGYIEYRVSPNCNNVTDFLMGTNGIFTLHSGESTFPAMSTQCPTQPLGPTTLTIISYQGGGTVCGTPEQGCWLAGGTEVDRATVNYIVTE